MMTQVPADSQQNIVSALGPGNENTSMEETLGRVNNNTSTTTRTVNISGAIPLSIQMGQLEEPVSKVPGRYPLSLAKALDVIKKKEDRGSTTIVVSCAVLRKLLLSFHTLTDQFQLIRNSPSTHDTHPTNTFTWFPKLPLEIRRMIWELSLYTARAIPVSITIPLMGLEGNFTRPRPNIRAVCQEARGEATRYQQQLNKGRLGKQLLFMNPAVDTVWISAFAISDEEWLSVISRLPHILVQTRILRLAITLDVWTRLMCGGRTRSLFLNAVSKYHTEEIVVVVGDYAAFGSPDLRLIEPRKGPIELLHTNFLARFPRPPKLNWELVEKAMMREITTCQTFYQKARQRAIDEGRNPDSPIYRGTYRDLSHWNFQKVRFREAIM